jgi:uncharacterized membrane protein
MLAPVYLIACGVHIIAHLHLLKRLNSFSRATLLIIAVSHGLLLLAFLVQYDMGDSFGWFAAVALLRGIHEAATRSTTWEENPVTLNILAFAPVGISWLTLLFIKTK